MQDQYSLYVLSYINNFYLSIEFRKSTNYEYKEVERQYTSEALKEKILTELEEQIKENLTDKEIANKDVIIEEQNGAMKVRLIYEVLEKIGVEEKLVSWKEKKLGERSLRVVDSNKTFFGKLSNTLSKIMIPTKIGINGLVINLKRNNLIKVYEANTNFKDNIEDDSKKQAITDKYQESYSLYLEAIDKYIMDSIYKKVKNNTASEFEKQAMGDYYKITVLKENEYIEYKYRKQKYLSCPMHPIRSPWTNADLQ